MRRGSFFCLKAAPLSLGGIVPRVTIAKGNSVMALCLEDSMFRRSYVQKLRVTICQQERHPIAPGVTSRIEASSYSQVPSNRCQLPIIDVWISSTSQHNLGFFSQKCVKPSLLSLLMKSSTVPSTWKAV